MSDDLPRKRGPRTKSSTDIKPKRQPTGDYKVGNCRPPKETQFVKGGPSPNKKGRPRGPALQSIANPLADESVKLTISLLDEPVAIGDKKMPVIEAAMRRLFELGITHKKERSLHKLIDINTKARAIDKQQRLDTFNSIVDYKELWGPVFKAAEDAGLPPPNRLPHPADLVRDSNGNWDVRFVAFDEAKKAEQDILVEHLQRLSMLLSSFIGRDVPEEMAHFFARSHKKLLKEFHKFNSILPSRLKVPLPTEPPNYLSEGHDNNRNEPDTLPRLNDAEIMRDEAAAIAVVLEVQKDISTTEEPTDGIIAEDRPSSDALIIDQQIAEEPVINPPLQTIEAAIEAPAANPSVAKVKRQKLGLDW